MLAVCVASSYPFTFNLFIALHLKSISLGQHVVGSCWGARAFFTVFYGPRCAAFPMLIHFTSVYLHTSAPLFQQETAFACYLVLACPVVEGQREGPTPPLSRP